MTGHSALYAGAVVHRRLRPRKHRLRYRVFWMLIDLDELAGLPRRLSLFSHNRFNAVSFYDADHGDGGGTPLREQIDRRLRTADVDIGGGRIGLLCMPRIFGYGFNPLSIFFCYRPDGSLAAILYEVHNTFGERHSYLFPVEPGAAATIRQHCHKTFHVSPFMDMDMRYAFRVIAPGTRISVAIETSGKDGLELMAALAGTRTALTDAILIRLLMTHPLVTLKVIAAIHWQALRMVLKGFRVRRKPNPPENPLTVAGKKQLPA